MNESIIKVQNLSKRYRLGLKEQQADTLVGQFKNILNAPYRNYKRLRELSKFGPDPSPMGVGDESVFWALKDVNFEVKEGEVLGIIGKNGAGKSTLLKILSQITEPTSGRVEIHGRVASLLEVGTGFHPELTGRENIYMNGTILGMTKREIDCKLDEIIDFSGVEKFVDTPVKFYSSGMKVRLGFSVAAHLDPEILIIDEVLAVGDFEFQQKCLGKMEDVSKNRGKTILFVSHNMSAIRNLCSRAVYLENGNVKSIGNVNEIIQAYFHTNNNEEGFDRLVSPRINNYFSSWCLINGEADSVIKSGSLCNLKFEFICSENLESVEIGLVMRDINGEIIYSSNSRDSGNGYISIEKGEHNFFFSFLLPIRAGDYHLDVVLVSEGVIVDQWIISKKLTVLSSMETVLDFRWQGILMTNSNFVHEKMENFN